MSNLILLKNNSETIQTTDGEEGEIHILPKGINPKGNVIAWLEFELAYYDIAVEQVSHYNPGTLPVVVVPVWIPSMDQIDPFKN